MAESIKFGISADGHSGAPEANGHPSLKDWGAAARESRDAGVLIFAHFGDWSDHGTADEAEALARVFLENFLGKDPGERVIIGVLGNHDRLLGQEGEIIRRLGSLGIRILENKTALLKFADGIKVGIVGLDGSVSRGRYRQIENFDQSGRTAALHDASREEHYGQFVQNMNWLNGVDADAKVVFMHVPPVPEGYSDTYPHGEAYEMHPDFAKCIARSEVDWLGFGHVHSIGRNPMWRRAQPRAVTSEGTVFYSVPGQTLKQEGLALVQVVDTPLRRGAR